MSSAASRIRSYINGPDSDVIDLAEHVIKNNRFITVRGHHYHTTGATIEKGIASKFAQRFRTVGYAAMIRKFGSSVIYEVYVKRGRWAQHRMEQGRK